MAEVTFITGSTGVLTTTISDIEAKVQNVTDQTDEKLKKLTDKIDADFEVFDLKTDVKIREAIRYYDDILKPLAVVVGAHLKKQHENKFIQWLLIKLFGYELEYKTIKTRTVDVCQWCFEEPPVEGKCVCQSCIDWAKYEQAQTTKFDLATWLEENKREESKQMKLNIDHLINCYEEMIQDNPKEAATYEVSAISAEFILYGLKQQRDYINELESKLKENNK